MTLMPQGGRSASQLWQEYAFLTREMAKMLLKQDLELFLELMDQRDTIQVAITALPEDVFKTSMEGRDLLSTIETQNKTIAGALQRLYNNSKQRHQVVNAYDNLGTGYTGIRVNRQS
ncbi:hypothetical protein [Sporomusa sp.]|uniref:hypothetical protein n=1 Tax=Sporomusa sp. TaxID=2078658 RepID=UPI002B776711|nr:hypothetical protein [Sporomusa sp.]HWR45781.1 hypothetical protein [Sporomusa sp.]